MRNDSVGMRLTRNNKQGGTSQSSKTYTHKTLLTFVDCGGTVGGGTGNFVDPVQSLNRDRTLGNNPKYGVDNPAAAEASASLDAVSLNAVSSTLVWLIHDCRCKGVEDGNRW